MKFGRNLVKKSVFPVQYALTRTRIVYIGRVGASEKERETETRNFGFL